MANINKSQTKECYDEKYIDHHVCSPFDEINYLHDDIDTLYRMLNLLEINLVGSSDPDVRNVDLGQQQIQPYGEFNILNTKISDMRLIIQNLINSVNNIKKYLPDNTMCVG